MVTKGVADVMVTNRMTALPSSPSVTGGEAARLTDSESALDFRQARPSKKCTGAPRRDVLKPYWLFIPENNSRSCWGNVPRLQSYQAPIRSIYTALTFPPCGRMFLALITGIRVMRQRPAYLERPPSRSAAAEHGSYSLLENLTMIDFFLLSHFS